uniref:Large ribosomal subunit protein bL21m n=1 Tax=Panagrolaimus davidi TaxID=227884 RepID=A0A914PH77_9BILA
MISRSSILSQRFLPLSTKIQYASTQTIEPKLVNSKDRQNFVANQISEVLADSKNRLFAVIFAHNRQFKVSQNDIIHLHHNSIIDVGQKIQLEKVLLVGGRDFTLFGRPLLNPEHVKVFATVIEKTAIQPELNYVKVSGKKITRTTFQSRELNVLRINEIIVDKSLLMNN